MNHNTILKKVSFFLLFVTIFVLLGVIPAQAQTSTPQSLVTPPIACKGGGCPPELNGIYNTSGGDERCVETYVEFKEAPNRLHFWAEDPEITTQGKADERARQFIAWTLTKSAIDDHPVLKSIWNISRNVSYFLVVLVTAILGIGFIVGQRARVNVKIQVWPALLKVTGALLYITFSATIVLIFIQISEILMKFFIENLGADKLFNIYFADTKSVEQNYTNWVGCRDLNLRVQESAGTELFLLQLTNITYYVMGTMIILRKIILWFMLFVSPFLAILFPFVLIRNIGWIWVGVFFQWLFYGPLFALFLGAMAKLWREGIPFIFDFQRANNASGYVYPTATNILYGGPAQRLTVLNNGNYIDTFVEYVITLIMLWAVIFFPWWLLRIFRDYCCDGIYAMKNILLSVYDQMRGGPSPSPTPSLPIPTKMGTAVAVPTAVSLSVQAKLETIEEIKRTQTQEIIKALSFSATKITDIARFETNHQVQETVRKNLEYLSNPTRAQTPTERQKYMNIRTELFNRAVKEDSIAKQVLMATSTSKFEQIEKRKEIIKTIPNALKPVTLSASLIDSVINDTKFLTSVSQMTQISLEQIQKVLTSYKTQAAKTQTVEAVATDTGVPKEKVSQILQAVEGTLQQQINSSLADSVSTNTSLVDTIAQDTQLPAPQVRTVLASYKFNVQKPADQIVDTVAKDTGIAKEKITNVIKTMNTAVKTHTDLLQQVAQKTSIEPSQVEKMISEPTRFIEKTISIPATIALEDYEDVKKMWIQQYEKGEVPVTENITSREQWVDQDIVFITNTLNKLLSPEETIRLQGFDEVGYILPIFMMNNLKGEELMVYLKAKLEGAKQVQDQIMREKEVAARLKTKTEEVFIEKPAAAVEEMTKTMSAEEQLPPDNKPSEQPTTEKTTTMEEETSNK